MEIIRSLESLNPLQGSVLTLGSYDGIHRGHREILSSVVNHARAKSLPSVLITFDPHPRHVLEKNKMILPMLMSIERKLEIIKKIGLQYTHIIEFTIELGTKSIFNETLNVPGAISFSVTLMLSPPYNILIHYLDIGLLRYRQYLRC